MEAAGPCRYGLAFKDLEWVVKKPGQRVRSATLGDTRFSLVEFSAPFEAADWCTESHVGWVIKGSAALQFGHRRVRFHGGDAVRIPAGDRHRHKLVIGGRERITFLFMERVDEALARRNPVQKRFK